MNQDNKDRPIEAEVIEPDKPKKETALQQIVSSEVDMQVTTAKRFPRRISRFGQEARTLALATPEIAQSCFYVLPRGGQDIEGPSIRLAEIVAGTWGNLRCETRITSIGDRLITAQATCWDMQRNVLISCENARQIVDKYGKRYKDHVIVSTGNAACSIALRNAIFRVVPRCFVDPITEDCKKIAATGNGGIDKNRRDWVSRYVRLGVDESRIFALLDVHGVEDMGIAEINTLQGIYTALSEGQLTLDEAFPAPLKPGTQQFGFRRAPAQTPKPEPQRPSPKPEPEPEPEPEEDPWVKHLPGGPAAEVVEEVLEETESKEDAAQAAAEAKLFEEKSDES